MSRQQQQQFMSRFRFQDNSLATFDRAEQGQIKKFQEFSAKKADGFCAVCLCVLYPEDQQFRKVMNPDSLKNCAGWKLKPMMNLAKGTYMVCGAHKNTREDKFPTYVYPGDIVKEAEELNYRERCVLSPLKLMTQITRKSTLTNGRIGHYEVSGAVGLKHNFEFAEMAYGGTLGLFYQRGDPGNIRKNKVKLAYAALQKTHPLLSRYDLQPLMYSLVNYHIKENSKYIGVRRSAQWPNNYLLSEDTVHPLASEVDFKDLYIGEDYKGKSIRLSHPSLLSLLFPYLYTSGKGHYSLAQPNEENQQLPEENGGISNATLHGENLKGYTRLRLMMKDRRFAKDQSFLFFMLDTLEKNNIAAANKFVVSTKGRGKLRQKDIIDNVTKSYNKNIISTVPYVVRSSYAYKRRNFLNLQTIFNNLGAPQLFLTFSCDDYNPDFKAATGTEYPWQDPVLFANHFKRRWNHFFGKYILGHFAKSIGGIKDYSWVLEIQDRGSPHIHCVLWTNNSVEELIKLNVATCKLTPKRPHEDPLLHNLVLKHQVHVCNATYCKLSENRGCRFGYPKPPAPRTEFVEDTCIYERGVEDMYINSYNPYLLAVWRANMDIQYNRGKAAVRYLAKYMAKNEADTIFQIANKADNGRYKTNNDKTPQEHYKNRIVGAVEAVYDIMGWHKHQSSRSVVFLQTNLSSDDRKLLKHDIKDIDPNSDKIFARSYIEKYESRTGAKKLTMPQFFCFYREANLASDSDEYFTNNGYHRRPFYDEPLPKYVKSGLTTYVLKTKESFWRTFQQSELNGEKYYYQQIVTKKAIYKTTFEKDKGPYRTWRDYFEYLITIPEYAGGISVSERPLNIQELSDVSDFERGREVTESELRVMRQNANHSQKAIFDSIIHELHTNSVAFVSGAAGTGKSYLLKMLERHYKLQNYKVFKLAPTGVAAHNIGGMTIHRFFGMNNSTNSPNHLKIDELLKLHPKIILLIDEYSMLSQSLLNVLNDALIKATNRNVAMGGVKTLFFGDLAQLLPVNNSESPIWESGIFCHSAKYSLSEPVRQSEAIFIDILNKVRVCNFDESVIRFINSRTVLKKDIPNRSLRLYTTRKNVNAANTKDFSMIEGEPMHLLAHDTYNGGLKKSAASALNETRLLQELTLKINMPVMLIQNLHIATGWVNGTIAQVKEIDDENILLSKETDDGEEITLWVQRITRGVPGTSYLRSQFPIVPAFASTIHKAQSATIDSVAIHLDNMLSHGQLYVAMSRVRRSQDLYFFGSELPLRIKRKYGLNLDAIDIVEYSEKRQRQC